jgi:DNA (cytosine-5)-methyltransferase 1
VFGEQVESAIRHGWLDLVSADLESIGYAVGAVGLPAASVGAPHIRNRLWFVADAYSGQCDGASGSLLSGRIATDSSSAIGELGHSNDARLEGHRRGHQAEGGHREGAIRPARAASESGSMADTATAGRELIGRGRFADARETRAHADINHEEHRSGYDQWSDCDWLPCRDGKARPVEPGTFPLVNGASSRVGRLRAYGNAIVPQVAAEVIHAYMECRP